MLRFFPALPFDPRSTTTNPPLSNARKTLCAVSREIFNSVKTSSIVDCPLSVIKASAA